MLSLFYRLWGNSTKKRLQCWENVRLRVPRSDEWFTHSLVSINYASGTTKSSEKSKMNLTHPPPLVYLQPLCNGAQVTELLNELASHQLCLVWSSVYIFKTILYAYTCKYIWKDLEVIYLLNNIYIYNVEYCLEPKCFYVLLLKFTFFPFFKYYSPPRGVGRCMTVVT